jgi:hypothetical protein
MGFLFNRSRGLIEKSNWPGFEEELSKGQKVHHCIYSVLSYLKRPAGERDSSERKSDRLFVTSPRLGRFDCRSANHAKFSVNISL